MGGKLSAVKAKTAAAGKHGDGDGLWLHKRSKDHGKWVLLFRVHGRRREMGLGPFPDVSLKEAREAASNWRAVVRQEKDPIKERERLRREAERNLHILDDVARDAFESRKAELKGDGKAGRWFSPIELHVLPKLGKVPVAEIDQTDIRNTLAPLWHTKSETATKALNRLGIVIRHAAALGLDVDMQAVDKAKALLGAQRRIRKHIPALHWSEVPEFYKSLNEQTATQLALRLLILTGVRSMPVRFANITQIEGNIWTIPPNLIKGRVNATSDFRVPLSKAALHVIEQAIPLAREGFLFPSVRKGVLSDATMSRFMERRGMEARPHGFRSSLRDWLAECTDTPHEVAETVLGHETGGSVVNAYRRTDFLEQRLVIAERWADLLIGGHAKDFK